MRPRAKRLVVAASVCAVVAGSVWIGARLLVFEFGVRKVLAARLPRWRPDPGHRYPMEYQRRFEYLLSDLAMRRSWGPREGAEILAMIATPWPPCASSDGASTPEDEARVALAEFAQGAFVERVISGAPIEPGVYRDITVELARGLDGAAPLERLTALRSLADVGMLTDPTVLEKVKLMRRDPDPQVAALASRVVKEFSPQVRTSWEDFRTRMGWR